MNTDWLGFFKKLHVLPRFFMVLHRQRLGQVKLLKHVSVGVSLNEISLQASPLKLGSEVLTRYHKS